MKSILMLLPMFMQQIGSSEHDYLVPIVTSYLTNELKRIGLVWAPEATASYVHMSVDLFLAEQISAAQLLINKVTK